MESKQNNSIITLLSALLLTSVIIAGFFAYKTQNLVKEITKLKSVSTPDKTNTQLSPTGYINKKFGYSIDLPVWDGYSAKPSLTDELVGAYGFDHALIQIEPVAYNESNPEKWWAGQTTEYFTKKPASCFNLKNINSVNKASETNEVIINFNKDSVIELERIKTESGICSEPPYNRIIILDHNNNLLGISFDEPSGSDILSTLKLIEPVTNGTPVACTMDAKLCPDGSSVGRSGPNCEFAACPTISPQP